LPIYSIDLIGIYSRFLILPIRVRKEALDTHDISPVSVAHPTKQSFVIFQLWGIGPGG